MKNHIQKVMIIIINLSIKNLARMSKKGAHQFFSFFRVVTRLRELQIPFNNFRFHILFSLFEDIF